MAFATVNNREYFQNNTHKSSANRAYQVRLTPFRSRLELLSQIGLHRIEVNLLRTATSTDTYTTAAAICSVGQNQQLNAGWTYRLHGVHAGVNCVLQDWFKTGCGGKDL